MACDDLITNQDLENAKKDATTMSDFVESDDQLIVSKNGKTIRTLQGINDDAQDAIDSFKLKSKGQYLPDPVTLNDGFEYVVYLDKTYFAVSPPYTTDPVTYPTPDLDTVNLIEQSYLTRSFGEKIAGDGDSQLAGGNIFPLSSQDSAENGDPLTAGVSIVTINDERYFIYGYLDGVSSGQVIDNIDLTPPYSCTIDGTPTYLLKIPYFQLGRTTNDIRALGAVGDFSDTTKTGTDNAEVFRALVRDIGGEWSGIGFFYSSITLNYKQRFAWRAPEAMGAGVVFDLNLVTEDGIPGHIFHRADTDGTDDGIPLIVTSTTGSDGSVIGDGVNIRNVTNIRQPVADGTSHGVWLKVRAHIGKANISNWPGNGLHIVASGTDPDPYRRGNANSFFLENSLAWGCGVNGVYVDGADANAGKGTLVTTYFNREWGIYDSSFLGNSWYSSNTGLNDIGQIKVDNLNARTVFIGPYQELSTTTEFEGSGRQIIIGGNVDASKVVNMAFLYAVNGAFRTNSGLNADETVTAGRFKSGIGGADTSEQIQWWESTDVDTGPWRVQWDSTNKSDFFLRYKNINKVWTVTGENTTLNFGRSAPQPYTLNFEKVAIGPGDSARVLEYRGAAPTSGLWAQGDFIFRRVALVANSLGWSCTTGGTGGIDAVFTEKGFEA